MLVSRDRPLPPTCSVREGRDAYLVENGFSTDLYDAPKTKASFFIFHFNIPNTKKHKFAIRLHDLHHVATGYGTDLTGEAEISAWELRRGLRGIGLYVGAIVVSIAAVGLVVAPRRTLRAFRRAPGDRSLFQEARSYEELLSMNVGDLRASLGIPEAGVAERARKLHPLAPR